MGTSGRRDQVRQRLIARGLLVPEERKVLGLFPVVRHRLREPAEVERLSGEVREVQAPVIAPVATAAGAASGG